MHWSEEIARKIIERNPDKEEYVCAAGISPSGSIHIGNFRDIATSWFVVKSLRRLGKKARLLFSWDEFDRLRKVPVNVAAVDPDMEKYIGMPYVDVKDPFGCHENYAVHFQKEFENSIAHFGIDLDFRYQSQMYRSGKYAKYVIHAIKNRKEIFDENILNNIKEKEDDSSKINVIMTLNNALNKKDSHIMILKIVYDYSFEEISKEINETIGVVQSSYYKSLKILKQYYKGGI